MIVKVGISLTSAHAVRDVRLGARMMIERTAAARRAGLDSLARQVAASGVHRVRGNVIIDDRLFDTFFGRPTAGGNGPSPRMWVPVLDVHETKDDLILSFELPGVSEKDVSLSITGDLLTLKGERAFNRDVTDDGYQHESVPTGSSSGPSSFRCRFRRTR